MHWFSYTEIDDRGINNLILIWFTNNINMHCLYVNMALKLIRIIDIISIYIDFFLIAVIY